ncbi:protein of unknown function [Kyrpidia spormannii]|uniref:Uncharacterized protein n=1 Tax=Kyrpidia spormannii TaxID=2055160 RepID=A0ACA8Z5C0_9BACL|nr:protein of unknown function [Kyrpidia spormannii]
MRRTRISSGIRPESLYPATVNRRTTRKPSRASCCPVHFPFARHSPLVGAQTPLAIRGCLKGSGSLGFPGGNRAAVGYVMGELSHDLECGRWGRVGGRERVRMPGRQVSLGEPEAWVFL